MLFWKLPLLLDTPGGWWTPSLQLAGRGACSWVPRFTLFSLSPGSAHLDRVGNIDSRSPWMKKCWQNLLLLTFASFCILFHNNDTCLVCLGFLTMDAGIWVAQMMGLPNMLHSANICLLAINTFSVPSSHQVLDFRWISILEMIQMLFPLSPNHH